MANNSETIWSINQFIRPKKWSTRNNIDTNQASLSCNMPKKNLNNFIQATYVISQVQDFLLQLEMWTCGLQIIARIPEILDTNPPLLSTRLLSFSDSWSTVISSTESSLNIIARESPTLPTISFSPLINIAVTGVEPPREPTTHSKISSSVTSYALCIARFGLVQKSGYYSIIRIWKNEMIFVHKMLKLIRCAHAFCNMLSNRWLCKYSATCLPECP